MHRIQQREPEIKTFALSVDYTRNFDEIIEAGKFDRVDKDINTANFPLTRYYPPDSPKQINLSIVSFNQEIWLDNTVNDWFIGKGLQRHANIQEICSLAEVFPGEVYQNDYHTTIGLGSIWKDRKGKRYSYRDYRCGYFTPAIYLSMERRNLEITWYKRPEDPWWRGIRFALIGK